MTALRGVETAFVVMLLVDLIKSVTPKPPTATAKLVLIAIFSGAGAFVITPTASPVRDVFAAAFLAGGLAMMVHEAHSVLSTFVDANIRQVLANARAQRAPAGPQVQGARRTTSHRNVPPL